MKIGKSISRKATLIVLSGLLTTMLAFHTGGTSFAQGTRDDQASREKAEHLAAGPSDIREAETFVNRFFGQAEVAERLTGAVVVLVKDEEVLLQKGYGYADITKKTPMDPERSVFRVASITKLFTATAVMQLVEEGRLDLHADIQTYLGDFILPNRTNKALTMEHLLTHTSGFDYTDSVGGGASEVSNEQFLLNNKPTIVREPGEGYRYDNYAYNLQGYIVERISGVPFSQYVQEHIFQPLGMENSSLRLTPELRKHLATPYTAAKEPIPEYPSTPAEAPDGGMFSTGADMARFMIAQLNEGRLEGERLLTPASIAAMQKNQHQIHANVPGTGYGFESFYQESYNGQKVVGKGGDLPGYHSWMWLLPEQKIGGFVVFNGDGGDLRGDFFKAFMDHYYPEEKTDIVEYRSSPDELSKLTGIYQDLRLPFWIVQVTIDEQGNLLISDPYGEHTLRETEPFLFIDEAGNKAAFAINANGSQYASYHKMDSWLLKVPEPRAFNDVGFKHPYASWINEADQLGLIMSVEENFDPEEQMSRADFITALMQLTGLPPSSSDPSIGSGEDDLGYVRRAIQLGLVQGRGPGSQYAVDAAITRQEAAVLIWRAAMMAGVQVNRAADGATVDETDSWARDAVQFLVSHNMLGPDTSRNPDGTLNYRSKATLLRQEAMVLLVEFCKKLTLY